MHILHFSQNKSYNSDKENLFKSQDLLWLIIMHILYSLDLLCLILQRFCWEELDAIHLKDLRVKGFRNTKVKSSFLQHSH